MGLTESLDKAVLKRLPSRKKELALSLSVSLSISLSMICESADDKGDFEEADCRSCASEIIERLTDERQ